MSRSRNAGCDRKLAFTVNRMSVGVLPDAGGTQNCGPSVFKRCRRNAGCNSKLAFTANRMLFGVLPDGYSGGTRNFGTIVFMRR